MNNTESIISQLCAKSTDFAGFTAFLQNCLSIFAFLKEAVRRIVQ